MANTLEIDFMFEIAFNKALPDFYDKAFQISDENILLISEPKKKLTRLNKVHLIYDVPSYLKVTKKDFNHLLGFKSVIQHKGYYIDLSNYNTVESYLEGRFSKSSRQLLRAGKKRIETCFDISYKMYHGAIPKELYNKLFKQFYDMLKLRAKEKGINNRNLKHWSLYTSKVYDMILNKQASLFVIYDGDEAINISLNMHVKNTVFLFITTYNIDYSKFRLGHTNWMMQIDWFIENNIKTVDFSKGNIAYKKRWANNEYDFEYHLFYNKSNFLAKLKANWLLKKLQLKQTLRNLNINTYYYNFLAKLQGGNKFQKKTNYQLSALNLLPESETIAPILFRSNPDFLHLKRTIYTYLYLSSLHVNDLEVYKDLQNGNIYYFKSPKEILKLIL